jgi:putative colanic acid biosynthesis acetyltransferase WcaF
MFQDLSQFRIPDSFRGRSSVEVQLWWMVHGSLFRYSPQFAYRLRRAILRLFGARIGKNVKIRSTVTITYPWKLEIGDHSWIGDDVVVYSLGPIRIGHDTVISQRSYICAADHDMARIDFAIRARPINIGNQVWVATDVFIGPGVSIGDGTVVGARSSVFANLPPAMICLGTPCRVVRDRSANSINPTS